ncbi:MAG TPA: N-acetylmuramic acid 6-phosphate etherase [Thermoleophilaceae bacterium]|nr:N-acetylmuramic acid 6-phosphate etherase [Thermoleophilaceae bacterium]
MTLPETERLHPASRDLSSLDPLGVIELMDTVEPATLAAVADARPLIAAAAERIGEVVDAGGRVAMLGAGTSGRIVAGEISELAPTFGEVGRQFQALVAGGGLAVSIAVSEDDVEAPARRIDELALGPGDAVVGVAASGTTPFVVAGVRAARAAGAWTCGMASNAPSPLLDDVDLGVRLATGPEILTGSTRLQAATAQKLALNRMTTAAMVSTGRVARNQMVDMRVSVDKLKRRAVRIVADLAEVTEAEAEDRLARSDWVIRRALEAG